MTQLQWRQYRLYGVTIRSSVDLGLPAASGAADVRIRTGAVPWTPAFDQGGRVYDEQPGEARLAWRDVGRCVVRDGRDVLVAPDPSADPHMLRLLVLGPVMAALHRQRGQVVLHGSAVARDGDTVGIIGWCGWGKSTTAAGLCRRGWEPVGDDLIVLEPAEGAPRVQRGGGSFRLLPASLSLLGINPAACPVVHPASGKRAWAPRTVIPTHPARLRLLVVLAPDGDAEPERMRPADAVVEVVRHSFTVRGVAPVVQGTMLRGIAALVEQTPVVRVRLPSGPDAFARMDMIARAALEEVRGARVA